MDDTSCTNRYDFPILVIFGIDKYNLSQLVAFVPIRDRTASAVEHFLRWVKTYLREGQVDMDSDPTPKAFVVDRHDGQLAALREVFPRSGIVFAQSTWVRIFARPWGTAHQSLEHSGL
jgi:hypothetical protein